jgi:hypothetical protein
MVVEPEEYFVKDGLVRDCADDVLHEQAEAFRAVGGAVGIVAHQHSMF